MLVTQRREVRLCVALVTGVAALVAVAVAVVAVNVTGAAAVDVIN